MYIHTFIEIKNEQPICSSSDLMFLLFQFARTPSKHVHNPFQQRNVQQNVIKNEVFRCLGWWWNGVRLRNGVIRPIKAALQPYDSRIVTASHEHREASVRLMLFPLLCNISRIAYCVIQKRIRETLNYFYFFNDKTAKHVTQ